MKEINSERCKWAFVLLVALVSNAFLLVVFLLQLSGVLILNSGELGSVVKSSGEVGAPTASVVCDSANVGALGSEVDLKTFKQAENGLDSRSGHSKLVQTQRRVELDKIDSGQTRPRQSSVENLFQTRGELITFIQSSVKNFVSQETFIDKVLNSFVNNRGQDDVAPYLLQLITRFFREKQLSIGKRNSVARGFEFLKTHLSKLQKNAKRGIQKDRERYQHGHRRVDKFHSGGFSFRTNVSNTEYLTGKQRGGRKRRNAPEPQADGARRRSDVTPEEYYSTDILLEEVFSTLTDDEVESQPHPVQKVVIPALIHFESMVIRQLESHRATLLSLDHRLEELEKEHLNRLKQSSVQSDAVDNKTGDEMVQQIVGEDFIPVNSTAEKLLTVIEGEGSGDVEEPVTNASTTPSTPSTTPSTTPTTPSTTVTTTTTSTTTLAPANHYEVYRDLAELEQKVQALENYNIMNDGELQRTRREVVKMDDKVTELVRKLRNQAIRASSQNYRVADLEVFMGKAELSLHTAQDAFVRLGQKLDVFKDRFAEYKTDIRDMKSQFVRSAQIMNELRSADSYKAHDINELRESLLNLEERLNGLYRVVDQQMDSMRGDVRTMVDRVCFSNGLSC